MSSEPERNPIELRQKSDASWLLRFQDRTVRLRDTKGVAYLSELIARPCEEIPATALAGNDPYETNLDRIESDRLKVTKSIKAVLRRLNDLDPEVAYHLRAAVRTGRRCSYEPPPAAAVAPAAVPVRVTAVPPRSG